MISFNLTFLLLFCIGKKYDCNCLQKKNKMWKPRGKKMLVTILTNPLLFCLKGFFAVVVTLESWSEFRAEILSKYFFSICQIPSFFTTAKVLPYNQIKPPIHTSLLQKFILVDQDFKCFFLFLCIACIWVHFLFIIGS